MKTAAAIRWMALFMALCACGGDTSEPEGDASGDPPDAALDSSEPDLDASVDSAAPPIACGPWSGDAFYARPADGAGPGELVACETRPDDDRALRMLYVTEGPPGNFVTASALVILPDSPPPIGGWPVVGWAHGTTGAADACAPSKFPDLPLNTYVLPFVEDGWALVATDYAGLGTPGPHPYLVGESEAFSVLDAVAAARRLPDVGASLGTAVTLAGHSQGGHAALFARAVPDAGNRAGGEIVGTIAYAPGLGTPRSLPYVLAPDDPLWGGAPYVVLFLNAALAYSDGPAPSSWLAPELADSLPFWAESLCILDLVDQVASAAPAVGDLFTTDFLDGVGSCAYDDLDCPAGQPYWDVLVDNEPGRERGEGEVLLVQGMADDLVVPLATSCLADRLAERDAPPAICVDEDADHLAIVEQTFPPVLAWIRARLEGGTDPPDCDPAELPPCLASEP
ncbi:MAG: hypothetical protein HYY06_22885 [Deltaproteobacteria bacterium]|nr:hypothetical protein [Deltaproteobacteria bacterium]